jgi:hypothetical protein
MQYFLFHFLTHTWLALAGVLQVYLPGTDLQQRENKEPIDVEMEMSSIALVKGKAKFVVVASKPKPAQQGQNFSLVPF